MTCYLLHLNTPLSRGVNKKGKALEAGHYIGWAENLAARLKHHGGASGARFLQVCHERGIDWRVARIWEGPLATRSFERRLKNCKKARALCPICNPEGAGKLMVLKDQP